jgi:dTDP-4-dehydrorhamnose 3,5-epimerase
MIKGISLQPLKIIKTPGGDVMHAMKKSSDGYSGFGEVYFSQINNGEIKAWKRHKEMTLNLVVPTGKVRFVFYDDRELQHEQFEEHIISLDSYFRLTVEPNIWMGFQGLSKSVSIVMNIANLEHNPAEIDRKSIEQIDFKWSNEL